MYVLLSYYPFISKTLVGRHALTGADSQPRWGSFFFPLPASAIGRVRPRENIFLPRIDVSRYEPDEDSRFYATSAACRLGRIHSDAFLIEPSWSSVSRSPWGEAAKVCGGYGKRIVNGTTSRDAPDFIYSKAGRRPKRPRTCHLLLEYEYESCDHNTMGTLVRTRPKTIRRRKTCFVVVFMPLSFSRIKENNTRKFVLFVLPTESLPIL